MTELLEDPYFEWLCAQVIRQETTPSLTYERLLATLHATEFVWLVSGDDNRAEDGVELRDPTERGHMPCSVLQMLIAF